MGLNSTGRDTGGNQRPVDDSPPLHAAKLYHQFKGPVMPHKLLAALENFLASPETSLNNGDNWGLVQKWLIVAAQQDDSGGDLAK